MKKNVEEYSEDQILDMLLETAENLPQATVYIERLDMKLTLRGLTSGKVDSLKEQCVTRKKVGGRLEEKFDNELFSALIISNATANIEVKGLKLNGWGDERLVSRLKASGGEQVVRRMLLAGELDAVGDKVLELSGWGVEIEDIKN